MSVAAQSETLHFEAETKQILDLVAHHLYSDKEIFLRELISNSSDASDKLRYMALSDNALYEGDSELKIKVLVDKEARTVTISDNGIGMSREDVIEHLGTIAKSGTRAFRDMLEQEQKSDQDHSIGQFGVGFYSAFVVADKVVVRTRKAGMEANQAVYWESDGRGEYTIQNAEKPTRGTDVVLHLKKDEDEFLEDYRLRSVIKKYSDHILLPIEMQKVAAASEETEEEKDKAEADAPEFEVVNQANALWTLPKSDISDEQYTELYKHISHDFEEPLAWVHNKVEGTSDYTSLLYIPKKPPFDLYHREAQRGLKLYVRRVFIMDDAEHFMPMYLRFVKGIIDSSDLPLNISRELLQNNRDIDRIRTGSVKKVLSLLENMAKNDAEKYQTFWKAFGQVLKEGPAEDYANRDRVAKLLRFASTHTDSEEQTVSFEDYVSRMQEGQEKIYYLTADNYMAAKNSPLLEMFRKKGLEVLLLSERVDEWLVAHLNEFDGKSLQSIAKGDVDFGEEETEEAKQEKEKTEDEYKSMLEQMQKVLESQVKEVRLTNRLTDSPCCVVFDANDMSGHLQRMMSAAGQEVPTSKPIFEINPKHPLVLKVKGETDDDRFGLWSNVLLKQALLAEGETLEDAPAFVKQLNELLAS